MLPARPALTDRLAQLDSTECLYELSCSQHHPLSPFLSLSLDDQLLAIYVAGQPSSSPDQLLLLLLCDIPPPPFSLLFMSRLNDAIEKSLGKEKKKSSLIRHLLSFISQTIVTSHFFRGKRLLNSFSVRFNGKV